MLKELQQIDFSGGIRAEKIDHNFTVLEEQVARERLSVTGHGVSSGLDLIIDGFDITITEGSVIAVDGREVYLDSIATKIELPRLKHVTNEIYTVQSGGRIILPNIPYCLHRQSTVGPTSFQPGISIIDYSNSANKIQFINIQDNVIIVSADKTDSLVRVSYSYTNKRYDTVYINNKKEIKILEGTTSSSPSIMVPEDSMYILGYIEVDPFTVVEQVEKIATIKVKKDLRSLRNIYTDKNNKLFICGIPFDDLQIIHMEQPQEPFINQLWYDAVANKLRVWKDIVGIEQWINVNDTSVVPVLESKIWEPIANPIDRQVFIFHAETDMNMRFIPGKNELEIIIDHGVLHTDQFDEITLYEALSNSEFKQLLINSYGYTEDLINKADERYENMGIGFRLGSQLDKACYVEAKATHRVNENPLFKRFQRTATFSDENFFRAEPGDKVFHINGKYRFGENQLEVFLDGKKLTKDLDYLEGLESDYKIGTTGERIGPAKGKTTNAFTVTTVIPSNAIINYKAITSIYSYDHIEDMVGGLGERLDESETISKEAKETAIRIEKNTTSKIGQITEKVVLLEEKNKEHDTFLKKTDKVSQNNLAEEVVKKFNKGFINKTVKKTTANITFNDISPEDFVIVFDTTKSGNTILRRMEALGADGDYLLETVGGNTVMSFKTPTTVSDGSTLYITGIKFK